MSAHGEGLGYSIKKIFIILFVLTAIEVFWGMFFAESSRVVLWSGLLICAVWKGVLIFMYFMHMKYEKALVWSLILPTPLLIIVIVAALSPDVAFNQDIRDHRLGEMLTPDGESFEDMVEADARRNDEAGDEGGGGGH